MERTLEPELMDTEDEASSYDAMDNSAANTAFVKRITELGFRGRVLDIGTGPGHIPLLVCDALAEVTVVGVDLAQHMLDYAERHRLQSPHARRIEFQLADAKGLAFETATFDGVFSNTILHHIPEPLSFLSEARRVLRPDGALLIRDLYRPDTPERALELVDEHASSASAQQRELLRASLHAALTPAELRELADQAGLGDAKIQIDSDRHMSLQIRSL